MRLSKEEETLLNELLNKYENSKEFKEQKKSVRRIMINFYGSRNCFTPYDLEDFQSKCSYEEAVKKLKTLEWIDFEWVKGQENHIISKVWLCTAKVNEIYTALERTSKGEYMNDLMNILNAAMDKAKIKWVKDCFSNWLEYIEKNRKTVKFLPDGTSEINEFLDCIIFLSEMKNVEMLERVFSVKCFGDSKKFERIYKNKLVSVIKTYFLSDSDELTSEQVLNSVGIVRYPEQVELCGAISFQFHEKVIDYSPLALGGCISIADTMKAQIIIESSIKRILFIENKANYVDFIINHKKIDEIIIYHGGYYSPSKAMFYIKLQNVITNQELYHWGDIDFGGFDMFLRLKKNIFHNLKTIRMGVEELIQYQNYCIPIDDSYSEKLKSLLQNNELENEIECLNYMIRNKLKLEQEVLI